MTLPERARALAEQLPDMVLAEIDADGDIARVTLPDAEAKILAALEATRREALEIVIQRIKDAPANLYCGPPTEFQSGIRYSIAAIRGLFDAPDSEKPAGPATDGPRAA